MSASSRALIAAAAWLLALVAYGAWLVALDVLLSLDSLPVVALAAAPLLLPILGLPLVAFAGRRQDEPLDEVRAEPIVEAQPTIGPLKGYPDWILRVDRAGRLLEYNQPADQHFPRFEAGDLGKPVASLLPDRANHVLIEHLERAFTTGRSNHFEFLYRSDVGPRVAEMRISTFGDDQALLVSRDLTDSKTREATLRDSKERFALAAQGANDGVWDWNRETGEVYWSHQWKAMVGADESEVSTNPSEWFDRVHPDDIDRLRDDLERHLSGTASRFESEHRIRDRSGAWRWVLTRGMALRTAAGDAKRIAGSMTDLTNRRVVAAAYEKADLLEHATSSVGIGIAVLRGDRSLTDISPTLAQMTAGWGNADAWWADVRDLITAPPVARCHTCGDDQLLGTSLAEIPDPAGAPAVFEIAFTGHGHEINHGTDQVVLIKDVTEAALSERRLLEANEELIAARDDALAASRAKSTFLANMSHELRTPLNAIIGYSDMLLEDLAGTDPARDVARIHDAGQHLLATIAGILDLSRMEAGLMALQPTACDIGELAESATQGIAPVAAANNNRVYTIVPDAPGALETDAEKVAQILRNLLSNAAKFTRNGHIWLTVSGTDDTVVFEVRDTGIGIPEAQHAELFQEFYQVDLSSTKRYGGAGLGLALTARFVRMLGGTLAVVSTPGVGSTFTVSLPRNVPERATLS